MEFPEELSKKLNLRKQQQAFRELPTSKDGIDFSSNDYLGLASNSDHYVKSHQRLLKANCAHAGAGGSRLLTGNHSLYTQAESVISSFHHCEAALIYNSGYTANLGLISAVTNKDSIILYDTLCHASLREGIAMSKAKAYKFRHNDLSHLEQLLQKYSAIATSVFVITESVFSMDGDSPDLLVLSKLCQEFKCYCILDEAHAIGVFGVRGQGLAQQLGIEDGFFARVVTFGKALGGHGAAVLGSKMLVDYLINFSRPFIFTTAFPPIAVASILEAYDWMQNSVSFSEEYKKLHRNIALLRSQVLKHELSKDFIVSYSPIQCCVIPGNVVIKNISSQLCKIGMDVRPILAPTVPVGQERLRICLHSFNTQTQIEDLTSTLSQLLKEPS